jgi:import receptor subunit TOM70
MPAVRPVAVPVSASSSTWDRITSWASENKAVVYTIAGVAVVITGAGAVYYLNSDSVSAISDSDVIDHFYSDHPSVE